MEVKMKKRITISIHEYIYECFLSGCENVSGTIEEALLKSSDYEKGTIENTRTLLLDANKEIFALKENIKLLNKEKLNILDELSKLKEINKDNDKKDTNLIKCRICFELLSKDSKFYKFDIGKICQNCFIEGRDSHKWFKKNRKI